MGSVDPRRLGSRILPDQSFVLARAEEVRALPVAIAGDPAVGMAEEAALRVIELAEEVAALLRHEIHRIALVAVPVDGPWRVRHRFGLHLANTLRQPVWRAEI